MSVVRMEFFLLVGADTTSAKLEDAGRILSDTLRGYMQEMGVVNGLGALGYSSEDVPALVKGTLPQVCVCLSVSLCVCGWYCDSQIIVIHR